MECVNCGHELTEKFCPNCGQRSGVKRITFKEGWIDFWSRIYGFDGMFPRTLRDLTLRPGLAAQEYIKGNRARYYGPVGYFFLMITLFLLIMNIIDIDIKEFLNSNRQIMSPGAIQSKSADKILPIVMEFFSKNMKIIAFAIVPFHAFAARYWLFRKSGLNFMENMVGPSMYRDTSIG